MRYRTFGKLDWQPSALGFGAMRLPTIDGDPARIDEPEATRMIRYAIDAASTTSIPPGRIIAAPASRSSAVRCGMAIASGSSWRPSCRAGWSRKPPISIGSLDEQLARLQTERIDFYLLHALDGERWPMMRDLGVLDWAERAMADGRIGHLGFSFHDKYEAFQEIVDAYDGWTFCQIQYNYMDEQEQAGVRGLNYAADKGLAVVVMEPLRGGMLAGDVPEPVQAIWDAAPLRRTPADWALQWLWNQPAVSLVLSGMSTMAQVEQNIASAEQSVVGALTPDDLALIGRVRDKYRELCPIPCTDCKYCLPCPNEVAIPRIFELYNEAAMYNAVERSRFAYHQWIREEERANCCLQCGECEAKCPQGIKIMDWLERADVLLGDKAR